MSIFWIVVGVAGLWAGSELALRSTIQIAERRGVSQGFLGITVLAIGTDLPEVLVAVTGGIHQLKGNEASGVVIGNAVGSALAQGSFVLGLAGLFGHLHLSRRTLRRDGVVLGLAIVLLFLSVLGGGVSRGEGALLVGAYLLYAWKLCIDERQHPRGEIREPWSALRRQLMNVGFGMVIVLGCAELVVDNALSVAAEFGWDQTVIGLFLIGAGTSLPELALSLGAVIKGRASLAVGNIIGSNVFDLLVPVGLSALLHPLVLERATLLVDLPALAVLSGLALWFFARKRGIQRREALVLVGGYLLFAAFRLFGGGAY